jgi:hypothetical protein
LPLLQIRANEASNNFERDIQRILKEQELVTKRSREFENKLPTSSATTTPTPTSPLISQPVVTKVGFAAVQEMARLQENDDDDDAKNVDAKNVEQTSKALPVDTSDLSFLRFDPDFNKSPAGTSQTKPSPVPGKSGKSVFGKFPLEIPTPVHSPKVGLKRFGSFR